MKSSSEILPSSVDGSTISAVPGWVSPRSAAWFAALVGPWFFAPAWAAMWSDSDATLAATWIGGILIGLLAAVSVTDVLWRRIPNWATYPAILWGLGLNAYASLSSSPSSRLGTVGLEDSVLGLLVLFVPMQIVSSLSGGGKGDVKLVGALGALLGVAKGFDAVLLSFLAAGGAMLVWAIWRVGPAWIARALWRRIGNYFVPLWVPPPDEAQEKLLKTPVPLAPSFAVGTLLVLCEVRFDSVLEFVGL